MVYIFLNLAFAIFFSVLLVHSIRTFSLKDLYIRSFVNALALFALLSLLFLVLILDAIPPRITQVAGKAVLLLESFALINISFYFLYHSKYRFKTALLIARIALYALACYIIFVEIGNASMPTIRSPGGIESFYVFDGEFRKVFNWRWARLFVIFFRFLLPGFCALVMLLKNEYQGSPIEKRRGYLDACSLAVLWALQLLLQTIASTRITSSTLPEFSLVYIVSYVFPVLILYYSARQKIVLTKNEFGNIANRLFLLYVLPATLLGELYAVLFSIYIGRPTFFIALLAFLISGTLIFVWYLDFTLENIQHTNSTDYEHGFERELKELDYDGEMDDLAKNMVSIFKKYTTCSAFSLWIKSEKDDLREVVSSENTSRTVQLNNAIFERLLDAGKNIIAFNEVEQESNEEEKNNLTQFFNLTNSDCVFLFNEGKNLFSCITLAVKTNGDHYGNYDTEVFTRLYSYFFVFAYYMRNISNKDIIGTINRELRLSSQIITSIQENVDSVKNPKVDVSYKMQASHTIGGEFVDLIKINDMSHLFVIGAVSGSGIAASMSMVILKSIIRTFLSETHDFKMLVVRINNFIKQNLPKGTIFLGAFALLDLKNDLVHYINCGIASIFLYTKSYDNVIEIQGQGKVLGFVNNIDEHISPRQVKLGSGDILLACTEGIINERSPRSEQFGKNRMQRTLVANVQESAKNIIQSEYDAVRTFATKDLDNDICMLAIKYGG